MFRNLVILCLLSGLVSCNLEKRLTDTSDSIQERFDKIKPWSELPLRKISWEQALAMVDTNNKDVRRAKTTIESAERSARSVYTDLIPGVSLYSYFNNSVENWLAGAVSEGSHTSVNVTFSVPTLTQVPYRVYAADATVYAAEKALEGKHRECSVKLYKALRQQEVNAKLKSLESSTTYNYKKTNQEKLDEVDREDSFWQEMASILGNSDARWYIDPSTMPRVKWADYKPKLNKIDSLVLCEMAMQIERARLKQFSVALNYLPTMNMNLSSPSLFTSSGGTYSGTFLSSSDTTLNLSLSYSLDTKLSTWNTFKTNQEEYELTCIEVVDSLAERRVKLKTLMRSVEEYDSWNSYMQKRIAFERTAPINSSDSYLEKNKKLLEMEREMLNQELKAIESEVAFATEYGFIK